MLATRPNPATVLHSVPRVEGIVPLYVDGRFRLASDGGERAN